MLANLNRTKFLLHKIHYPFGQFFFLFFSIGEFKPWCIFTGNWGTPLLPASGAQHRGISSSWVTDEYAASKSLFACVLPWPDLYSFCSKASPDRSTDHYLANSCWPKQTAGHPLGRGEEGIEGSWSEGLQHPLSLSLLHLRGTLQELSPKAMYIIVMAVFTFKHRNVFILATFGSPFWVER